MREIFKTIQTYVLTGALYLLLNGWGYYPWWYVLIGLCLTWLWITSIISLMNDEEYQYWSRKED